MDFSNKEVIHIKKNKVEYLEFKALEKYKDKIKCIVTLRHGGVSTDVYNSLNFRLAGNDKKENVYKNLEIISEILQIDPKTICKGRQDHTDNIICLDDNDIQDHNFMAQNDEPLDGYVTNSNKLATLVTTADCNAIVIYDPVKNVAANIHSGWKGTTKRIYINAINKMKEEFNSKEEDLIVCVSPAILKCCFSSEDENFKKIFTDIWKDEDNYIYYEENKKRFHIDLSYLIKQDLLNIGIKEENIHFAGICTCCNDKDFYSYRAKTMKKQLDYGCMATVVKLL